jgi:hypothetical protein
MSTPDGFREEVLNVELAELLHQYGLVAAPERIRRAGGLRRAPDVVVSFYGLRLVIEGKVDEGPQAARQVTEDARGRLEGGLAHVALAVLYPPGLREVPFEGLAEALGRADLKVRVLSEAGEGDWITVPGVGALADHLRRVHEGLTGEDVVAQAAAEVAAAVDAFEATLGSNPGLADRIAGVVEVGEPDAEAED